MYKLGLLLLVSGALCQHQVTQQVTAPERQIRLEDIEREGLKTSAAQQQPSYQQQPQTYQQQHSNSFQQQAAAPANFQHQQPLAYQQLALPAQQVPQAVYPQFQFAPAAAAYHTPQLALHPQQLFYSGASPYQQQLVYLQPQAHSSHNVPLMLIPYPVQQDLLLPKLRPQISAQPQALHPQQAYLQQQKFKPSPQIQYTSPYNGQAYQQKFSSGVKSTPAPTTLKENYVQQQPGFNYKLQ